MLYLGIDQHSKQLTVCGRDEGASQGGPPIIVPAGSWNGGNGTA